MLVNLPWVVWIQPGKEVVEGEELPLDDALLLEAKIRRRDIAFLPRSAGTRDSAYDFAIYGGLAATVEQIGADTVTDDEGNAFYLIRVRTKERESESRCRSFRGWLRRSIFCRQEVDPVPAC
ncbi:MAG: hypothetical protein R3E33_02305 [Rhodocyclaceae bacterium]